MKKEKLVALMFKYDGMTNKYRIEFEIFGNALKQIIAGAEYEIKERDEDVKNDIKKISMEGAEALLLRIQKGNVSAIEIEFENTEYPWYAQNISQSEIDIAHHINKIHKKGFGKNNYNILRGFERYITQFGGLKVVKIIMKKSTTEEFRKICMNGSPELTIESVVLDPEYRELFSDEEKSEARRRFKEYGFIF